jgi:hypothetical protein
MKSVCAAAIVGLMASLLIPGGSTANAQSDRAAQLQARIVAGVKKLEAGCAMDAQKYCSTVTPGEGRLFFCILAHEDKLSTKCDYALFDASRNLERALDRVEDAADACWNDIEKHCANIPEGGGRIAQCLAGQKAALTQACQAAMSTFSTK